MKLRQLYIERDRRKRERGDRERESKRERDERERRWKSQTEIGIGREINIKVLGSLSLRLLHKSFVVFFLMM